MRSFIVGICLLVTGAASAQKLIIAPSTYNFKPLDQVLEEDQKTLDKNFTVLVYKNNQLVYGKEMGDAKAHMPVAVGSISKWLTAALTLALVDQGKLSLDDKVSTYLPIFKTYGKAYITVRQCLTHFTGLAGAGIGSFHVGKYPTLEAEVNDICAKREIQTNPGTEFRYSESGYAIVGRVLEVITKKPFSRLARETLFLPMNMQRSSFPMGATAVDPSEGALCAPVELMNFTSMILNKGLFNGKRILSEASISELLKPSTTAALIKSSPIGVDGYAYALGAWLQNSNPLICAPSLRGSWAFVDFAHGYAAVLLVDKEFSEPKKQVYIGVQSAIETALQ